MTSRKLLITLTFCLLHGVSFADNKPINSIQALHQQIKSGNISCREYIKGRLETILKYNYNENMPASINAISEINTLSLNQAKALDKHYQTTKQLKGVLHCVPVILKDNIDEVVTRSASGSFSLIGNQALKDAKLVAKLKHAGAIMIAKGTMDEFASGMVGYSSLNGRIGNALRPSQNPGGSSGGVAAAVKANFALVGIGTDNSGSVRIPASFNGLIGLRPTHGIISSTGIFPRGNLDGTAGVIARNYQDILTMFNVLTTKSKRSLSTHQRIGIIRQVGAIKPWQNQNALMKHTSESFMKHLKEKGYALVDVRLSQFNNNRDNNTAGEVEDVNQYLESFPSVRRNYKDICTSKRTRIFDGVKNCLKLINKTAKRGSRRYRQTLQMIKRNQQLFNALLRKHKLDAVIMPLNSNGGPSYDISKVNTWRAPVSSNAGLPAITLLVGKTQKNMPIGFELIGPPRSDIDLIRLAEKISYPTMSFTMPRVKPSKWTKTLTLTQYNRLIQWIGYQSFRQFKGHTIKPTAFQALVRNTLKTIPQSE